MSIAPQGTWIDSIEEVWGGQLQLWRVGEGVIIDHRDARHFLAVISLRQPKISVPVSAEFCHHPEYGGEELVDKAMETLRPRLQTYRNRGYALREVEWSPAASPVTSTYSNWQVPMVVAYMEQGFENWDQVVDELPWLVERLARR